jgi:uncharacterized repeat protein (TIGR01451 family)
MAQRVDVVSAYGKLPLSFESNLDQVDGRVRFKARGLDYGLFLTANEAVLALRSKMSEAVGEGSPQPPEALKVLRMKLLGANSKAKVSGLDELPGKLNYFIGNDPRKWRKNIPTYSRVRYRNAYPGIDLIYHGNQQQLEYDFIITPGASPKRIAIDFEGMLKTAIDGDGNLLLSTAAGDVLQHKPIAYQDFNGERRAVAVNYKLDGNQIAFETGVYDKSLPLIIDPVLLFSSYLGGTGSETGLGIAVDAQDSAYLTGSTSATDFPLTDPAQNVKGSFNDAFVAKLNPAGTALVYATYLGGNGDDVGNAIAIDAQGSAYVVGSTGSGSFPRTTGAAQDTKDGLLDGFVTKLSASGSSLVYSTFLGGDNTDIAYGVAVDASGRAHITGRTDSTRFRVSFPTPRNGSPLYKSINSASQWSPSATDLTSATVNAVGLDPSNSNTLYASSNNGVFKSLDAGAHWSLTGVTRPSTAPTITFAVAVDPSNPSVIYAGASGGLYKSTDGGALYDLKNNGSSFVFVNALAIDPSTPTTLYAAALLGVYKTTNGGDTWVELNNGLSSSLRVNKVVIDPTNPAILYVGTPFNGIFKTTNGGGSWSAINSGFDTFSGTQIRALAIDPLNPSTLYAGCFLTSDGNVVYKTTNGGATWTGSSAGLSTTVGGRSFIPSVNALTVDPVSPTNVYAGTSPGGIFKSTDGGANWIQSNAGFPNSATNAIAVNFNNPAVVYAGTAIGGDAFAVRLNAAGTAFEYVLNFGGDENDEARGIALDESGNAYFVGTTNSQNFPVLNAFQPVLGAFSDAFVMKLNPSGTGFVYSTYLGGGFGELGRAIAVQGGSAYVTGQTASTDFPLVNPFKATLAQFDTDAFVTKVNPSGTSLGFSTYLGGVGTDQGLGIAVGPDAGVYVTGVTLAQDFPTTVGAPQASPANGMEAFVIKLSSAGTSLVYSTYLGGVNSDQGNGIAVDSAGNAYVVGTTFSGNFPIANPYQSALKGSSDAFITKIGPDADLSITKTDSRDPVMVGNNLSYTLAVSNAGPDEAAGITVSDTLPASVVFVSATPSQGFCTGTGIVTCNLGSIAKDASATVTVVVTPPSLGTITNTATVSSSTPDHDTINNSSTQQTRVSAQPSIAGRVTTAAGAGVVSVSMALTGSHAANTITAANGVYQFADLSSGGNYNVTPTRQGFVFHPQSLSFNNLTADATGDFNAVACLFQITPANQSVPAAGGSGSVTITGNDGLCPWTATNDVPWITVTSSAFGSGAGTVNFSVAPTNIPRSGTLRIAGNVFTVWQELSPCSTPTFTSAPQFHSSPNPEFVAQGDFNNDGKPDVALLSDSSFNSSLQKVSVLLGTGAGGFVAANSVNLAGSPRGIAVGDFNNDGKLDVAAVVFGQSNNVRIFLGDGAGNLSSLGTFTAGGLPTSVAVGNFNGDANADLAVSNEDSHNVSILLGTGTGGFGPPTQTGNSLLHSAQRVVISDINKDGKQDLIVQGTFLSFLRGHGDGTFDAPTQLNPTLVGVIVGDFNKDGKEDLAGSNGPVLITILGDGAGGFGAPLNNSTAGRTPSRLVVSDVNGDGNADLESVNNSFQDTQDVSVFLGDGTGLFTPGPAYLAGVGPRDLAVADFNGDGRPDLAVADTSLLAGMGELVVLTGTGTGGFVGARSFVAPISTGEILADDFNGDSKLDLMAFTSFGFFLLPATAPGEFGTPTLVANVPFPTSDFGRSSSTRDFNHDGKPDIAVLSYDSSSSASHLKVFLNNGAGVFAESSDTLLENFNSNSTVRLGDFNADGNPDFISVINISGLALRLGNGAGGFNAPTIISPQNNQLSRLESGDFNGDRKLDLAVSSSSSSSCNSPNDSALKILFGDGTGSFSAPSNTSFTDSVSTMAAEDLNGDGRSDLVVVNGCTQKVVVLFANAAGSFSASSEFAVGNNPRRLVLADFSGDGKPDLVVNNTDSTSFLSLVSVLTGNGSGGFSAPTPVTTEIAGAAIAAGDLDGNGHYDLVLTGSGHIGIFLNSCPVTPFASTLQFTAPSFSASEGAFLANITVTRTGDASSVASVRYATVDGSASGRSDYTAAAGTLNFAPGETSKSFPVLLTDDALVEGAESLLLVLSSPLGAPLGTPNSAVLNLIDNDGPGAPNPIGDSQFFVRQHYHDFLNREPDSAGLQFWVDQIEGCGNDAACRELKRINVSAAFFLSIEFQETGYLVYRMYNAAYGETTSPNVAGTVPIVRLQDFLPDTQQIGQGVQVGIGNWEQQLENNKVAYALDFVQRQRFLTTFPLTMTASEFVAKLDQNTTGVLSADEKSQLIALLGATPADAQKRASVVRKVADDSDLRQRELNRAFVLMQFYGYLRRNPDDPQDTDFRGWKFWLDKLNQFNGNFVNAEMVKAFLVSGEYRQRFGAP